MTMLTLAAVKEAARKYYADGKLTAQHPDPEQRICAYAVGDYRCAIGAALDEATVVDILSSGFNTDTGLDDLFGHSMIDVEQHNQAQLRAIQNAHDTWACSAQQVGRDGKWASGSEVAHAERLEAEFVALIQP